MDQLEKSLLETLSFYDPMTREEILLQLDYVTMKEHPYLTVDDLDKKLFNLKRRKLIKLIKGKSFKENRFQRIFKKRNFLRTFFRF